MKVIGDTHNHDLSKTLVGHRYAGRLKSHEHSMIVYMMKIIVKLINILLTINENKDDNVLTIGHWKMSIKFSMNLTSYY